MKLFSSKFAFEEKQFLCHTLNSLQNFLKINPNIGQRKDKKNQLNNSNVKRRYQLCRIINVITFAFKCSKLYILIFQLPNVVTSTPLVLPAHNGMDQLGSTCNFHLRSLPTTAQWYRRVYDCFAYFSE